MDRKIEFNLRNLVIFLCILAGGYILWRIRGVLFIVALAYLISAAVLPLYSWFMKKGILRTLSIFLAYSIVLLVIVGVVGLVFPPLINESSRFYAKFPDYFAAFSRDLQVDTSVINSNLEQFGASVIKIALSVVSNTVEFVTIFVISIYLSFERKNFKKYFESIFGERRGTRIHGVLEKIEVKLGRWIRGQIFLDLIIGGATYVGLTILGLPYAVPLAVMAGVLEAVPNIGPILASIPAVIIGFSISPLVGFLTMILYVLIQQMENHLIVPRVMAQVAGLRPLAVIIVLLVGGSLMGTIGVILAIPAYLIVATVVEEVGRTPVKS